jgi:hypothetical protein
LSRSSDELVLQVIDSYDYRFQVRRRDELLEMIQRFYEESKEAKAPPLQLAYSVHSYHPSSSIGITEV